MFESMIPGFFNVVYYYLVEQGKTVYIYCKPSEEARVPPNYLGSDGSIVLNISPQAVTNLQVDTEGVSFTARFNGNPFKVYLLLTDVLAITTKEYDMSFPYPFAIPVANIQEQTNQPVQSAAPAVVTTAFEVVKPEFPQPEDKPIIVKKEKPKFTVIQGGKS